MIEAVLGQGKQALVLVPEIGLTPQTLARFRKRFRVPVVALHSGLTDLERLDAWEAARSGRAPVVIGTRSAIFTPLARPGAIIVDEEHDGSFKQQDGLRYHARDLAIARAHREGIPILLGSATPSLESLAQARSGRYRHLRLTTRASRHAPARLELTDLRGRVRQGGLIPPTIEAIRQALAAEGQVLVFINRRGFSPSLACHQCGWIAECSHCDSRLTLHRQPPRLVCHHCEHQQPQPDACPSCGSADLRPLGAGTERTEETLATLFPKTPIYRIDRDSTRRKEALDQVLGEIRRGEPSLLVGTQMLAKGHHLPHVTLVVVVNADAGLYASDFRALEQSAQLLIQVAGRAGRAERPGRVLVQTLHPATQPSPAGRHRLRRPRLPAAGGAPSGRAAALSSSGAGALRGGQGGRRPGHRRGRRRGAARVAGRARLAGARPGPGAGAHGAAPEPLPCPADAERRAPQRAARGRRLAGRAAGAGNLAPGALVAGRRPDEPELNAPAFTRHLADGRRIRV